MYFDGGSRGNPGLSGAGCFLEINSMQSNNLIQQISMRKYVDLKATNNIAEYEGLLLGIKEVEKIISINNVKVKRFCIRGDSDLIVNQLTGHYQCRNKGLKPKFDLAMEKINYFIRLDIQVTIEHVKRCDNKIADGK